MILSESNTLLFDFTPGNHDQALGFGRLRVSLGKSLIWSDERDRGIAWTWIDLLEQLGRAWPFLKYEETVPPGVYDGSLSLLRNGHVRSPDYFDAAPESAQEIYIFLRRHNLATGIEGLYLPSLSFLREGRKIWIASTNIVKLLDFAPAMRALAEVGDTLAEHIAQHANDERARLALETWRNREPSREAALQIQLGSIRLAKEMITRGQTLATYFEAQNDEIDESSLLIAARMSEAVPLESRRTIVDLVRARTANGASALLRQLSAEAQSVVPEYTRRPHEQGEILARWARSKFGFEAEAKADPRVVLQQVGVEIVEHHFGVDVIDAVGCWSSRHGPAILVNLDGKHAQSLFGRRATLAHELAHVLVDREGSLPAAEVLGGNVPRHPEQRANAFAAEFLLPKSVLIDHLRTSSDPVDTIKGLRNRFAVSRELAAWQIINTRMAYDALDDEARALVRSWTPTTRGESFFQY